MTPLACRDAPAPAAALCPLLLEEDPFPGNQGDKEKLVERDGIVIYRLHISRSYTVFYEIDTEEKLIIVHEILPIEQAHRKYRYY